MVTVWSYPIVGCIHVHIAMFYVMPVGHRLMLYQHTCIASQFFCLVYLIGGRGTPIANSLLWVDIEF